MVKNQIFKLPLITVISYVVITIYLIVVSLRGLCVVIVFGEDEGVA